MNETPPPYPSGPFQLERRLVRRVGVDAAVLFAELAEMRALACIGLDDWFAWDGFEFMQVTAWDDSALKNAFRMLQFNKLAQIRKTESAEIVEFKLNFYQITNICSED
jgi:hypothetical protein